MAPFKSFGRKTTRETTSEPTPNDVVEGEVANTNKSRKTQRLLRRKSRQTVPESSSGTGAKHGNEFHAADNCDEPKLSKHKSLWDLFAYHTVSGPSTVPTDTQKTQMVEEFKEELDFDVATEDKRQMTSGRAMGFLEQIAKDREEHAKGFLEQIAKDREEHAKQIAKQIEEHTRQIAELFRTTDKMKRLREGELEYWVALDRMEEQTRQDITTKPSLNINHRHRKERNDRAHGGSILLDTIVLSEHLTKYAASAMEPAFTKRYGKPWREAKQLIDSSDTELVNVFDMRASALVLFEYDEDDRHGDREDMVKKANKILAAHSGAPTDKRKGMLQPSGQCYNSYDEMRDIHRRVIGYVV